MPSRSKRVLGVSLIALAAMPLVLGSLRISGRIIVPEGDVLEEDLYAFGELVIIEGVVRGDLFAVTGELKISGVVEGDVIALVGGPSTIDGTVGGALRIAGIRVDVAGTVGDDVAGLAIEADIGGSVGRDLLFIGGEVAIPGSIGRDVRLQAFRLGLDGVVGRDVLVRVDSMSLGAETEVRGDALYQASQKARVADGATVTGLFTRRTVLAPIWAKALTRAFSILSLLGLIVAGLAASWVFRGTSRAALEAVTVHPVRSAGIGVATLIALPLLTVPLFLTLVGIPVALFVLLAWLLALALGPIPAVTRLGGVVLRQRGTTAAALVIGAVLWRLSMWALPLIAALIYLIALVVGLGGYVAAGWEVRRRSDPIQA
jgi:hypothetical protein